MTEVGEQTVTADGVLLCRRCRSPMHLRATGRIQTSRGSGSGRVRMHFVCLDCGQEREVVRPA